MRLFGGSDDQPWDQSRVKELGWRELELMIGAALQSQGYDVEVTPRIKDGGLDVDADKIDVLRSILIRPKIVPQRTRLIIDAKQWNSPVGAASIEKIADTADDRGGTGVIASPSGFWKSAKDVSNERGVRLYDCEKIVNLFNNTQVSKSDIN
jgi:HJR/Mrr/RecB family endonuclease